MTCSRHSNSFKPSKVDRKRTRLQLGAAGRCCWCVDPEDPSRCPKFTSPLVDERSLLTRCCSCTLTCAHRPGYLSLWKLGLNPTSPPLRPHPAATWPPPRHLLRHEDVGHREWTWACVCRLLLCGACAAFFLSQKRAELAFSALNDRYLKFHLTKITTQNIGSGHPTGRVLCG